jgi:hypothetical protein
VNLWTAISTEFAQNDRVIFELYRYPEYGCHKGNCGSTQDEGFFAYANDDDGAYAKAWFEWCQEAIDTIRTQGANNIVLVPGLKKSSCRDWTGAQFWGETLDNSQHAGNLRLFGLEDPVDRTAYSVQQYFDSTLTGQATGCDGHDTYEYAGWAADEGCLMHTAELAKTYNKKLWLTETASFTFAEPGDANWTMCDGKMDGFLEGMAASGVFLGYQVWQFGCHDCAGGSDVLPQDLYTLRPYNLEWYDFEKYGITSTTTSATSSTRTTRTRTATTVTTFSETSSTTPHTTTESSTTPHTTTETSTTTVSSMPEAESSGASRMLPAAALAVAALLAHLLAR